MSPVSTSPTAVAASPAATPTKAASVPEEKALSPVEQSLSAFRETLKQHGARGIYGLARKFKIIDDDGSGTLEKSEFVKAIKEHALGWSQAEMIALFNHFDEDKSGSISYDEFLVGVRGELNERREQLVLLAFSYLDKDKNGTIDVQDIAGAYNADKHPDVLAKKKSKGEVFREFLDTFDGGEKDGKVTPDEFKRYYANLSASIDDDDYFELMIRNAWHISGGEGWCANTTCRRVLVTHEDGTQTVEEIKDDLGITADDKDTMKANLAAQGIDASKIDLTGSVDTTEPPKAPPPPRSPRTPVGQTQRSSVVLG